MILKKLFKYSLASLASLSFCVGLSSCDIIYDYDTDCEPGYYVNFVYDMNLKWADAFPSEVHSLNLYVFDKDGVFVKQYSESGSPLSQPGFNIKLDLAPGDYTLVAWCGLNAPDGQGESFTVTAPVAGETTLADLNCSLNVKSSQDYPIYSDTELKFLYQGNETITLPDTQDGADYYYTVRLTKDTNHIRVILQELSGENVEATDYDITIDCEDAEMAYDNSLVGSTMVTYLPWAQISDEMTLTDQNGAIKYNRGLIADLSVARLLAPQWNQTYLTIRKSESPNDIVAQVPIIDYALLAKSYYEEAYGHIMSDQEFLDREDEYQLTFFLYQGSWISSYIYINSWRIVLNDYNVGS